MDRGDFAAQLRRLRQAASLTQEELASRAGLTGNAIGALERGERRRPYPYTVRAIADALGVDDEGRAALVDAARAGGSTTARSPARPTAGESPRPLLPQVATTPLVGRDIELRKVVAELRSGRTRLLTVTGPGGVGKTRLAMAAADAFATETGLDVALAELAPLHDPGLLLPTIARALGLRQSSAEGLVERLATYLAERPRLLVLDNVEHVLVAAPDVGDLIARSPSLTVLATSRAPLRIRAEREFPLAPLALPASSDLAAVAASPAVQMFIDRVGAATPSFALTSSTAAAVAAICRRLDGLPLAMELAAAHARLLEPGALLNRLDQAVSSGKARDLPERQATMRATLDWSHDLLTADEQRLLRWLSVFAGGFTLDAAEAVSAGAVDVFDSLSGLVEQSLVEPEISSDRYRMLEPIRQYAFTRLDSAGEASALAEGHAAYFCGVAGAAREGLRGIDQAPWLDRLQAEHANLRAALATLLDRGNVGSAGGLLADTWLYWALRGTAGEGLGWAERVLGDEPAVEALAPEPRAAARIALAGLRYATGDVAGTATSAAAAASDLEGSGEPVRLAEALVLQGSAAMFAGEFAAAAEPLDAAVAVSRGAADQWALAQALIAKGQLQMRLGETSAARASLDEAEAVARDLGGAFTLATTLNVQASLALLGEDEGYALDRLDEAARLAVEVGTTWTLIYTLPALAVVAGRRRLPDLAATLFSAGVSLAAASSLVVAFPPDREFAEQQLRDLHDVLDEAAFQHAWDQGRELLPADLADYVTRIRQSGSS